MPYVDRYNRSFGELGAEVVDRWPEAGEIRDKGKTKDTLGLALSGGGYRSAIFNYGVLRGLYSIGALEPVDYLSVVSGGSWIGTAFIMAESLKHFFSESEDHANFIEEAFESLLPHPGRVLQEAALSRKDVNYLSDIYGRLLARTFLREHGDYSRYEELSGSTLIRTDRPYLIVNGTVYFRRPRTFDVTQECFEMTRGYCGSRSLGYVASSELMTVDRPIRIRDVIAVSGAAAAAHIPVIGGEIAGVGLSREVVNYTRHLDRDTDGAPLPDTENLDVADGGFYNNLGIESLINRGCGYLIVVDAEHDPERKSGTRSNQSYHGLRTLLKRRQIATPLSESTIQQLDRADEAVHVLPSGSAKIPDILYIKLKSCRRYDKVASAKRYNKPGFLENMFGRGRFSFDPQFSTAKLDYDFAEHRNLSELGGFLVRERRDDILRFVGKSK